MFAGYSVIIYKIRSIASCRYKETGGWMVGCGGAVGRIRKVATGTMSIIFMNQTLCFVVVLDL